MRYIMTGLLMTAGVVWLVSAGRSPDGYYAPGDVTRWEHASRAGSAPFVLGAGVVASFIAVAFLFHGVFSRRLSDLAALCGGAIYVVAWMVAWVGLMGGH